MSTLVPLIHCESFLSDDDGCACEVDIGIPSFESPYHRAPANTATGPRWDARRFVFAIHHPDLRDRLCPRCIEHLRHLVRP